MEHIRCFLREKENDLLDVFHYFKSILYLTYFQHDVERDWEDFLYISDQEGWKIAKYIGKTYLSILLLKKRSFYFNALQHNGCMMHFLEGFLSVSHELLCQLMNVFFFFVLLDKFRWVC